ncbi:electron transport complex subunit RsxC [Granulosicoccus sp. 3-233]|uniref:electron transport complex subunit RsxC n=1 Tax=Granulosicoccus sp. 3-233 TaxID=3417969 RepID=UPI003D33E2FA
MKWPFLQAITGASRAQLHGGLRLPRDKPGLPLAGDIRTLALPPRLILPLLDYRRDALPPLVQVGQEVEVGQHLAAGVIATASGRILSIEPRPVIHPSGKLAPCVILEPDEHQDNDAACYEALPAITADRLDQCGVTGLGGAAFATADKLTAVARSGSPLQTLLINAVECEPQIACDEALMMCDASAIIKAIDVLKRTTQCRRCVLAVENDKTAAISAIHQALQAHPVELELMLLEPVYPAGAERSLIRRITGRSLAPDQRPASLGILSINVATALAAYRASQGFPLHSRIVTVSGEGLPEPVNVRVRFGTPVEDVLRQCHYSASAGSHRVRANGPLSGFDLHSLQAPITASTNNLGIHRIEPAPTSLPCIRCGACEDVCPEQLLPQQLYWYAQADDLSGSRRFGLDSCITCGCCDLVCPSAIPLTQAFRHARDAQREQARQERMAALSQQRHQAREQRLQERAAAREERRRLAKAQSSSGSDPIADALARARQRRKPRLSQAGRTSAPAADESNRDSPPASATEASVKRPDDGRP